MELLKNIVFSNALLFATFLLFASLNLSAQYKLELEWMKGMERIVSITKSDNDSLLYVSFENLIATVKTSDGSIVKLDTVDGTYNLKMSRDGKTLVASSGWDICLLDPQTFKRIYWEDNENSDYTTLTFNERQNKIAICGNTFNNPKSSFIKVYDLNTKSLFKEFSPSYFGQHTNNVKRAMITDDSKYIIYSMASNLPNTNKSFLIMIDLEGKVVKDFGETSSTQFTLTNDGKTLIYFMSDAIHFFDIDNLKEIEGIALGMQTPSYIEMSNDGKFMLLGSVNGSNGVHYFDLVIKKYFSLWENGAWNNFKLNKDNSSLFLSISEYLYRFDFIPINSVNEQNRLEFTIQVIENEVVISSQNEIKKELTFKISSIDGKNIKNVTLDELQFSTNSVKINISDLLSGTYLLQVSSSDGVVFFSKFIKMD